MFFQSQAFPTEEKPDFVFFWHSKKVKGVKKTRISKSGFKKSQIGNPAQNPR